MMNRVLYLFFLVGLLMQSKHAIAQGCSDAGVCTMSEFKPGKIDTTSEINNRATAGFFFGSADRGITVFGSYLEFNRKLGLKFSFDLKLTSISQSGNDISTFGFGDLFVSGNYKLNRRLGISLGIKIPLTDGNRMQDGISLPMDYQSSLGTFDFYFGASVKLGNLQLALALQQPLTQSKNAFFADNYPENNPLSSFQSTNNFIRSGDVLLRASYLFKLGNRFSIIAGLLPIYHFLNDKYTNRDNIVTEIIGSKGLTLNANIYLNYAFNSRNNIQLNLGAPLIIRDARPDGLTRHFIATFEYSFSF